MGGKAQATGEHSTPQLNSELTRIACETWNAEAIKGWAQRMAEWAGCLWPIPLKLRQGAG